MAVNNIGTVFNLAQSAPLSSTSSTAQASATATSTTAAVGTRTNPYVLQPNAGWVDWNSGTKPQFISYQGNLYKFQDQESSRTLRYSSTKQLPNGQNNLRIRFSGESEKAITGYTTERVQVGTNQVQVGTEKTQVGTEKVQVGTESYQTGTEKVQVGTERYQTGTEQYQTGTEHVLTGYKQVQTGTEQYQTGTEQVLTGYKQVQTGTEQYQTGTEQVLTGYKQVQTGTETYQTGTERVQTGTERVQTGTEITGYNTTVQKGSITVNRELDGKDNAGAVGDTLDQGTSLLLDANKANSFFTGTAASKYKVSSLTGEDNQATGNDVDIFKKTDADDMYVAGDPQVGGKGNAYKPDVITPGTGYMTMFEDGTDTGRKVTVNAHVDQVNSAGNKAFTEYGFVVQDDAGQKTTATLSGGQLKVNGQVLLPGQEKVIGDPNDPVARFYYASMPGGENGTNEQRVVFESYEKVTPQTRQKLIDAGADPAQVDALRSKFQSTYGFRIPDGNGSYRASAGVPGGLSVTGNGVKTYYDAHFSEPDSFNLETTQYGKEPIYGPVYTDKPVYEDKPTYGQRPVYTQQPVYEDKPTYGERPVYTQQPVYEDKPTYGQRPVYTQQPVYEDKPTYGQRPTYGERPVYEDRPTYGERPKYEDRPKYEEKPIYKQVPVYENQQKPIYGTKYKIEKRLSSPLVLDLDGDGIDTTPQNKTIDINGDGQLEQSSWFGPKEGVLAFDANKNGRIDLNGKELFGDSSDINGDGQPDNLANGFDALRAYATKNLGEAATADNLLDSNEIRSLENQAGLRMVVNNQTRKLSDYGIQQINLNYQNSNETDAYGNEFRQQSSFQRQLANGQVVNRDVTDVWLNNSPLQSQKPAPKPAIPAPAKSAWTQQVNMLQSWFSQQLFQWLQLFQPRLS